MWPHAKLRLDPAARAACSLAGPLVAVGHGDIIGRMSGAVLSFRDARISEAHAMVSLRGGSLHLLALRRRFFVADELRTEIALTPRLKVELADGLGFEVEDVSVAPSILGIRMDNDEPAPLLGVASIHEDGGLRPGYNADALAYLFSRDSQWHLQSRGDPARVVCAGERFEVGQSVFTLVDMQLAKAGANRTQPDANQGAMSIVSHSDSAHLVRAGRGHELTLAGISASIIFQLAEQPAPVNWLAIAHSLWPGISDDGALRPRWDMALSRLRTRLRGAGIRPNLVRSDGTGNVELFLHPGDQVRKRGAA